MVKDSGSFHVLLGLLDNGEKSGYDIKKKVENEIGYYYKISNGQIYPTLKKLVSMGYATLTVEKTDGKPDRKVYRITVSGRAAFREWLAKPVDYQNPSGNELLLKLYLGAQAPAEQNIRLLAAYLDLKENTLRSYEEHAKYFTPPVFTSRQDFHSYLTLRYGQILAEAGIRWCREAIEAIQTTDSRE